MGQMSAHWRRAISGNDSYEEEGTAVKREKKGICVQNGNETPERALIFNAHALNVFKDAGQNVSCTHDMLRILKVIIPQCCRIEFSMLIGQEENPRFVLTPLF